MRRNGLNAVIFSLVVSGCRFDASGSATSATLEEDSGADDAAFVAEDALVDDRPVLDPVDSSGSVDTAVATDDADASTLGWTEKDWLYRRRLVIDGSLVAGDLTDFVVPIVFTEGDMISKVTLDGRDLRFTRTDGTLLAFELVRWDAAGSLVAWVKVPKLGPALPNDLYLYYGNAVATSAADPKKTWSGEVGVWHFDENTVDGGTTTKLADATTGGHDGMQNGTEATPGLLLGAQKFDGKDWVELAKSSEIVLGDTDCTFSAWVRTTESRQQGILIKAKGEGHETGDKLIGTGHEGPFFGVDHGWVGFSRTNIAIQDGKWHHVAWVQNKDVKDKAESWRLYLDGVERAAAQFETKPDLVGHSVRIGGKASGSYFDNLWTGDIDEGRYSKSARGPGWIATLERSQRSPATFVKVGGEESLK